MKKYMLVTIGMAVCASSAWAAIITDDFNRADTVLVRDASIPSQIGADWRGGEPLDYCQIKNNQLGTQMTGWNGSFYNVGLGTSNTGGESFTLSIDVKGNPDGGVGHWIGGAAFNVQDGINWYGLRFKTGASYIQFSRSIAGSEGVSTLYNGSYTFLEDTYYTMTVSSDTPGVFGIDVREKGSATPIWAGTRDDTANGALSGGYGGAHVAENGGLATTTKQSFDNYSLETIPEPATFGLMGLAGAAVLFARRRFI